MNGSKGINIFKVLNEKSGFYANGVLRVKLICGLNANTKKKGNSNKNLTPRDSILIS